MPSETKVDLAGLRAKLNSLPASMRSVNEIIVHHTWSPTAEQYHGESTIRGVRRYHMDVRGWSDNGYHIMLGPKAPDCDVWLCRPLTQSGGHTLGHNAHSVGIAYVANFDVQEPTGWAGWMWSLPVVRATMDRFGLTASQVHFHREFADKSCPGNRLDLAWYRRQLALQAGEAGQAVRIIVSGFPPREVVCGAVLQGGTTMVDAARLTEGLGLPAQTGRKPIRDVLAGSGRWPMPNLEQGKVYIFTGAR